MRALFALLVLCLPASAGPAAGDPALAHAREVLAANPVIDGHVDLPWAVRTAKSAPGDVAAYGSRAGTTATLETLDSKRP